MLTRQQKEIFIELIKDGIMTYEIFLDGSNDNINMVLSNLKVNNIETVKEFTLKAFELGYINTYDGELSEENFYLENRKLLIIDINKVFEDNLFSEFEEYEDLKIWFKDSEKDILLLKDKALFISSLDNSEYINISENIVHLDSKILNVMEMMVGLIETKHESLLSSVNINVFLNYYHSILSKIDELPDEYQYTKDIYSFKNYYRASKKINSKLFKELNRNDLCLCNSGKKFKKCCLV